MEKLKDILRESIVMAKETGLWQKLDLRERKKLVAYFYSHYRALLVRVNVS